MIARRCITIPTLIGLTLLATTIAPLLLIVAWLLARTPGFRGAPHTLGLVLGYLWCETIGITRAFLIWLRYRNPAVFLRKNFVLQCWWATTLESLAQRLFGLSFEVTGAEDLAGAPGIMLPRHASIADTLIPMVFYGIPEQIRLRYVLKRELLLDPCLDVVGNRLPNYFVNRDGQDTAAAVTGVQRLAESLEDDEGLLFYPEGTRFSPERVSALRRRWADNPDLVAQLDRWRYLLPPRLGGTLGLLAANPGRDLLFCAHAGFEGSSHFSNLVNGAWIGARIHIHFWRVPWAQIPAEVDEQREFLFGQWDRMDRWVSLNRRAENS